jgi:hypothetical protein
MSLPLKCLLGLFGVLLLTWEGLLFAQQWIDSHRIIASPQNQSAFYKGFDPEEVIKRFRCPDEGYGSGGSTGAVQTTEFVKHSKSFEPQFTIESLRKTELVSAINEQIRNELQLMRTHVINRVEDPSGNFTYNYTTPNGGGFISVHSPVHHDVQRNRVLPSDLEDISIEIDLEETWYRPTSSD